ncbi:hypothetical protein ACWJKU_07735 [Methylocaldum sp. MU1018]
MNACKFFWFGVATGFLSAAAGLSAVAREALPLTPALPDIANRPPFTEEPSALPTVLIVPGAFSAERIGDGCWVEFYNGDHFTGTRLNIIGPVEMRSMDGPFGARWTGLESAVTGPRARVIAYDDEDFEQRSMELGPGERIPDLDEARKRSWLGFFEDIDSLRVLCEPKR